MKYKKVLFFIIVLIAIYLIYFFYHDKTIFYISLGDSFALGKNSYGVIDYGYSDYLIDDLKKEKNIKFYTKDFSKDKYYINDLTNDIIFNKKILIDDRPLSIKASLREANFITLSIGMDDIISKKTFQKANNLSDAEIIKEVSKDMEVLIKEILKYNRNIILVGYYNLYYNNSSLLFKKLNDSYKSIVEKYDIDYIDTYKIIDSSFIPNPNSFYLNKEGYKLIAREIKKELET